MKKFSPRTRLGKPFGWMARWISSPPFLYRGSFEAIEQPGACETPVAPRRAVSDSKRLGRLFHGQSGEKAQFDQLCRTSVFAREVFQGRVHPQQQIIAGFFRQI